MRTWTLLALAALFVLVCGCSGGSGVTPEERGSLEDFTSSFTGYDGIAGTFTITDLDSNVVAEGTLVRDDGKLTLGEIRNGEITIDLTWIGWLDLSCDFLNPRWYQPSGVPVFYYGDNIKYYVNIYNYAFTIPNASVRIQHKYLYGPKKGEVLPGSTKWWYHVYIPGCAVTKLYDEYLALAHGYIAVWGLVEFHFNLWFIHFDVILYNGICGIWEP
jgi:hypothetical protein